jgi:hypothetical protein
MKSNMFEHHQGGDIPIEEWQKDTSKYLKTIPEDI